MATYYIDVDTGNDSWDGLAQTYSAPSTGPKATGSFIASASLSPGDSVLFKRGTFNTTRFILADSGSVGLPVTIGAYGVGDKPIICVLATANSGWTDIGGGRYTYDTSATQCNGFLEDYIPISRASDANCNDAGVTGSQWYYAAGTITYKPASGTPGSHDLRWQPDGVLANANSFSLYPLGSYKTIQDLKIIGAQCNVDGPNAAFDHINFERCDFVGVPFTALRIESKTNYFGSYITLDGCTFEYCANNVYFIGQDSGSFDHATIKNCTFKNTNLFSGGARWADTGDIDGISIQNMTDSVIEHNEIDTGSYMSGGILFWFSSGYAGTNNIIRYNYIHNIDAPGISYGGSDTGTCNAQIYYNIIRDCGVNTTTLTGWSLTSGSETKTYGNNTTNDYSGDADTYLVENDASYPYGGGAYIYPQKASAGNWRNGLLKFTALNNLSGKTITAATLYLKSYNAGTTDVITAKKCLRNWVTAEATWNAYSSGNNWTTAGGISDGNDRAAAASCTLSNTSGTVYSGGGSQLVADVQAIADGGNNYGWHLERTDGSNDAVTRQFGSGAAGDDGYKPYLSVTYSLAFSYTYQVTVASSPDSVWENGVPLTKQTSTATVEANAGSWYWSSNTLYIHTSDSSNPGTNGKTYLGKVATITPNVSAGTPGCGMFLNRVQTSGTPSVVYNNTIYNCGIGLYMYDQADYYNFKNNIIIAAKYAVNATAAIGNMVGDYNDYYNAVFRIASTTYNFTDWKTAISGDANSITSNPQFANAGGSYALATDFKLKPQSPCINKGTSVGLTRDYFNKVVPQGGAVDIGASEYQGGVGFW